MIKYILSFLLLISADVQAADLYCSILSTDTPIHFEVSIDEQDIDGCRFLELISELYKQDLVLSVEYLGG